MVKFSKTQNYRIQDLSFEPYMNSLGPTLQKLQGFPEPGFIKEIFTGSRVQKLTNFKVGNS